MRAGGREWFAVTAVFGLWIGACLDSGDKDNDQTGSPVIPMDAGVTGGTTGGTGGITGGTGGTTGGTGGTTGGTGGTTGGTGGITGGTGGITGGTGGTTGGTGGTTGGTGGTTGGTGGTTGGTGGTGGTTGGGAPISIAGTAKSAMCLSTQAQTADKCGSYYCGINLSQMQNAMGLDPSKPCGTNAPVACKGSLTKIVTECTLQNATDAEARRTCVANNAEVMSDNIPTACQECFLTAATCCADDLLGCGLTCLTTDLNDPASVRACDEAQLAKGCPLAVFACGGLPNPF